MIQLNIPYQGAWIYTKPLICQMIVIRTRVCMKDNLSRLWRFFIWINISKKLPIYSSDDEN